MIHACVDQPALAKHWLAEAEASGHQSSAWSRSFRGLNDAFCHFFPYLFMVFG